MSVDQETRTTARVMKPDSLFWDFVIEAHPVCLQHQRGDTRALKVSDFYSRRELHKTRLYDVWFRPLDITHELSVPIPSPLWHTKTFLFDRAGNRDFTERDRLVLDRLQPHLARLWRQARTRRLLAAALAAVERSSANDARGVVLFRPCRPDRVPPRHLRGDSCVSSSPVGAVRVFPRCVRGSARSRVRSGHSSGNAAGGELTIERSGDALLLEGKQPDLLTAREREVLA